MVTPINALRGSSIDFGKKPKSLSALKGFRMSVRVGV
jgi:hypothetical protein